MSIVLTEGDIYSSYLLFSQKSHIFHKFLQNLYFMQIEIYFVHGKIRVIVI